MTVSTRTVDVVVIGSGFGGSIAANRLAATGMEVLLLERGPWRDTLPIRSLGIEAREPLPCGWRVMTGGCATQFVGANTSMIASADWSTEPLVAWEPPATRPATFAPVPKPLTSPADEPE